VAEVPDMLVMPRMVPERRFPPATATGVYDQMPEGIAPVTAVPLPYW